MPQTFLSRSYTPNPKEWVDPRGATRSTPMKVLVMGLPRTGTASMAKALEILGYNRVYHMASCVQNPPDCAMWKQACEAKFYGKGAPFGRSEWDQLLGQYQAVTDFPASAFAKDLIAAYPDAKVVLNIRNPESWYTSIKNTIVALLSSRKPLLLKIIDPGCLGAWAGMCQVMWYGYFFNYHTGGNEKISTSPERHYKLQFEQHYAEVRKCTPPERLLEFRLDEGWEPLCRFLEREVPKTPFPSVNESREFGKMMDGMVKEAFKRFLKISLVWLLVLVVGVSAIYSFVIPVIRKK